MSWRNEPHRHSLARRGIKTRADIRTDYPIIDPSEKEHVDPRKYEYFENYMDQCVKRIENMEGRFDIIDVNDINTEYQPLYYSDEPQIAELMEAIDRGEKIPPIVISTSGYLHDGRHRLEAYKRLGYTHVPVVYDPNLDGSSKISTTYYRKKFEEAHE